jgi:sec-independent protein translocase protein TatA
MFGLGMPEMIVILVVALIIFGPGKLPDLGNSIGKAIRGFKKSMEEPEKESENLSAANKIEDKKQ